jgi:hypothetical protein
MSLSSILATQLLSVVHATGCTEEDDDDDEGSEAMLASLNSTSTSCASDSVDLSSVDSFEDSHGPARFTRYTLLLSIISLSSFTSTSLTLLIVGISLVSLFVFTPYLPKNREQCHEWSLEGKLSRYQSIRAVALSICCVFLVLYVIISASLLLSHDTSCLKFFGGSGC